MATFREASQAKLALKMMLHFHSWYVSSAVIIRDSDYIVLINSHKIDNNIRKIIPQIFNDVAVKVELA